MLELYVNMVFLSVKYDRISENTIVLENDGRMLKPFSFSFSFSLSYYFTIFVFCNYFYFHLALKVDKIWVRWRICLLGSLAKSFTFLFVGAQGEPRSRLDAATAERGGPPADRQQPTARAPQLLHLVSVEICEPQLKKVPFLVSFWEFCASMGMQFLECESFRDFSFGENSEMNSSISYLEHLFCLSDELLVIYSCLTLDNKYASEHSIYLFLHWLLLVSGSSRTKK